MNINLVGGDGNFGETMESLQAEIDEHVEILARSGMDISGYVALFPEPEIPGVYRVWHLLSDPPGEIRSAAADRWAWITPDGEVVQSAWPWVVTN